jgi:signal transduction histidine kinase
MRTRWTPIEAVCETVLEAARDDVVCWVEDLEGIVVAGVRPEFIDEVARAPLRAGREEIATACVAGHESGRWARLLQACAERELEHQLTVGDMADATARLWKHTNALIRMSASTKISLEPAHIFEKILSILHRATALGYGTGVIRLPGDGDYTSYKRDGIETIEAETLAAFDEIGEDVRIVARNEPDAELRRSCTRLVGSGTPVAIVRLSTETEHLGFLVAPIEEGESVSSEELKVLASAAQIVSVAIENGFTLSRAMESMRLETENKLLEEQTRDMEEMVHVVAHDLRSPMTALYGFVHVALDELKDLRDQLENDGSEQIGEHSEAIAEPLRDAIRSVEKLNRMVQRLLEFSRAARGAYSFEELELDQVVHGVVRSLRYQLSKNEIEVEVGALPNVTGDRVQVEAVFGNLVDNAIKYIGDKPDNKIEIGCKKEGDERVFFVRDTGVGMNADQVSKAFLPFQRFHADAAPGDGIGLPHVRKIVERHGGRIWCTSEVGVGSTFWFTLGKSRSKAAAKRGRLAQSAARSAAARASA